MICTRCKLKIATGKAMVSVGYAGAPTHAHYHTTCFKEHVEQHVQLRQAARQLIADAETVRGPE